MQQKEKLAKDPTVSACCVTSMLVRRIACPFVAHVSCRTNPTRAFSHLSAPSCLGARQKAIPVVRYCMYNGLNANKELVAPRIRSPGNHHRPSSISSSVKSSLSSSPLSSSNSSSICSSSRLSPNRSKSSSSNVSPLLSPPNFPLPFIRG